MRLKDLMHTPVATMPPGTTIAQAAGLMGEKKIGCLLVTEGDQVLGILTERDILTKIAAPARNASRTTVAEIMATPVMTLGPDTDLAEAIRLMGEKHIRRVPIVAEGKLQGIVTSTDILLGLKQEMLQIADELPPPPQTPRRGRFYIGQTLLCISMLLLTMGIFALAYDTPGFLAGTLGGTLLLIPSAAFLRQWVREATAATPP